MSRCDWVAAMTPQPCSPWWCSRTRTCSSPPSGSTGSPPPSAEPQRWSHRRYGAHEISSPRPGIDWNVLFLLLGMMIIVGVLRQTGVFEFLAIWAAHRSRARPFRMMVLLDRCHCRGVGAAGQRDDRAPDGPGHHSRVRTSHAVPGAVLPRRGDGEQHRRHRHLIGDPPNLIIGSRAGLSFNDFLVHLRPSSLVLLVVFVGLCWLMWGRLEPDPARPDRARPAARDAITDSRLLGAPCSSSVWCWPGSSPTRCTMSSRRSSP